MRNTIPFEPNSFYDHVVTIMGRAPQIWIQHKEADRYTFIYEPKEEETPYELHYKAIAIQKIIDALDVSNESWSAYALMPLHRKSIERNLLRIEIYRRTDD